MHVVLHCRKKNSIQKTKIENFLVIQINVKSFKIMFYGFKLQTALMFFSFLFLCNCQQHYPSLIYLNVFLHVCIILKAWVPKKKNTPYKRLKKGALLHLRALTQALSSLTSHWKMSVLSGNPHRLLLIHIVCFPFNFSSLSLSLRHKAGRISYEEEGGSKVFDSNSWQTLRGTSSARRPLMFHTETDRGGERKPIKVVS